MKTRSARSTRPVLFKAPSGIRGLDEITGGGLPRGRPTLVCGTAGTGKTLFAMEFLVRGATDYNEPGVFMAFEETPDELAQNVQSLGFDLPTLIERKKLAVDYVRIERSEIEETGEYDLEGLFVRLGYAIDSIGAKRVVLDTLEAVFSGFSNQMILRSELRRLFRWLKDRGVTAVITAERGEGQLTRHGLEEYVSDCVILLDHRLTEQVATRRLRVVKYRGTFHGTNEYPFIIDENGFSVMPITSLALEHAVSNDRVSSGVPALDAMLGGKGYYRGSSVLVSGTAGTGKSSLSAHFVDAACRRGERCLYFAFEESPDQIMRNMRSIGLDLKPWVERGLLQFYASRPTLYGLETHLAMMHKHVIEFKPRAVVLDPINNFITSGTENEVRAMLMRLVDLLKNEQITGVFTSLTQDANTFEHTDAGISSLMDTWLLLRNVEVSGERNRVLYLLKSRGMPHSNQVREFLLSDHGVELRQVYTGPEGVLTGSARIAQEARERGETLARQQEMDRRQLALQRKRQALESRIAMLRAEFEADAQEMQGILAQDQVREQQITSDRTEMEHSRGNGASAKKTAVRKQSRKGDKK